MMDVHDSHRAHLALGGPRVAQVNAYAGVLHVQRQAGRADHVQLVVLVIVSTERKDEHGMASRIQHVLAPSHVIRDAANIRFIHVQQHADAQATHLRPRSPAWCPRSIALTSPFFVDYASLPGLTSGAAMSFANSLKQADI